MTSRIDIVAVCETDNDTALVESARRGNREAFDQLYLRYRDRIFRLCLNLCNSREEAGDLLQETFVNAWRGLPRFAGRASFPTWLHRIAVNVCRATLRRKRGITNSPQPAAETDPATIVGVRMTLEQLKPNHRLVLVLRYSMELSYVEIAECLNWPLGRVKATLHRARRAFRMEYS